MQMDQARVPLNDKRNTTTNVSLLRNDFIVWKPITLIVLRVER